MALAIQSYRGKNLADDAGALNLSWTLDERECLDPDLQAAIDAVFGERQRILRTYAVADPYGEACLVPRVAARFGIEASSVAVTCAAGVGALLQAAASRLSGATVAVAGDCYPDLPEWLSRSGARAQVSDGAGDRTGADALFFERPSLRGDGALDDLAVVAAACRRFPGPVIVDESNANYADASFSAVPLVAEHDNLMVFRGLSKAYGMGGLRVGYCASSAGRADWFRRSVAPLQASSLSLALAEAVLGLPAAAEARLHRRIAARKAEARALLDAAGVGPPGPCHDMLPYLLYDPDRRADHRRAVAALAEACVVGKRHIVWSGEVTSLHRFSVPLNRDRFGRFRDLMRSPPA